VPDIFDEVEQDLRAERAQRTLARYGGLILGALLLAVAGVGAWQGWRWWQGRQAEAASVAYLAAGQAAAVEGTDLKAAADRFASVAAESPAGYRTLARLRAAALKAETGDRAGALAIWDAVAADSGAEPLYRDLATLLWGLHALDAGSSVEPGAIEARLAPLAEPGKPWRASAEEIRALAALRRGATEQARKTLAALAADGDAPQGVRDRAGRMLTEIGG
jgi:hypothetical protein